MTYKIHTPFLVAFLFAAFLVPFGARIGAQQVGKIVNTNPITVTATNFTQIVAPVASLSVEVNNVWAVSDIIGVTTGQTIQFVSCTDGTCSTGSTPVTGVLQMSGPVTTSGTTNPITMVGNPAFVTTPGSGLFIRASTTNQIRGWVTFNQR